MMVSVIIPCYNVEAYVDECIASVLAQSYQQIEIICIDNNSSDSTYHRLLEMQNKYPEKITVLKELKKGASAARNKGLSVAKGDWIQFLDADDLLLPSKIEYQLKLISSQNSLAFVVGSFYKQNLQGKKVEVKLEDNDPFKALFITKLGNTCANLFNASIARDIGGWNENLKSSQETDFMFRILQKNDLVLFDQCSNTIIRERVFGQISQLNPVGNWQQYIELRFEMTKYLRDHKKKYFEKEKDFYHEKLFIQLKRLAKFNSTRAITIYYDFFNFKFHSNSGGLYSSLHNLIGFKNTIRILKLIGKI